ncbi:MAG: hypothetical protein M3R51_01870 [Candidatus Eremiobacteraeota bacterium]|nr:hypothetical protein [Candidatus Eremiobacteraeota bacterium]
MKKSILILAVSAGAALIAATPAAPSPSPTPLPTPPPLSASAVPSASAAPASPPPAAVVPGAAGATPTPNAGLVNLLQQNGVKSSASPSGTPTPPPDNRKGIEGVWEVQIQRDANTTYTHFKLVQAGNALTGTYLDTGGKRYPMAGSLDGTGVRLVISLADGSTILLQGRLDGTTDMLGMFTDSKERVPFTAAYRAKEKWYENINAQPGGLGNNGYSPPQ